MKTKRILLILSMAFMLSSCSNDWLNEEPTNKRVMNEITTLTDAEYLMSGTYDLVRNYTYYGARMMYYGDVTGEDVQAASNTKRCASYYTFRFTRDNAPTSPWSACYTIIYNSNVILDKIDQLDLSASEESTRDSVKGQALTLRALALFDLTRTYGYPYTKDNGASYGVPIIDKVVPVNYKPARNTVAECYAAVIKDLVAAVGVPGTADNGLMKGVKSNGRINRWGAMQILSRVYLYQNDNANALKYAEAAIAGAQANGHRLWTTAEYRTEWATEFAAESLFEVMLTPTEGQGNEAMGYLCYRSGYGDMFLSDDFLTLIKTDLNDVRYKCIESSKYIWKYRANAGDNNNRAYANIRVLRLSEAYLIAAEAAVKTGDNTKAIQYLEPIVKRANPAKTVTGTTVTLDRVLEERRKELVGEGHRMFDALRNGKSIVRAGASHLATIVEGGKNFNWDYYHIVLPLPKAELDANENMRSQQNPGY